MTKTNVANLSPKVSRKVKALRAIGHAGEQSPRSGAKAQEIGKNRLVALGVLAGAAAATVGIYQSITHNSAGTSIYQKNLGACVVNAAGHDVNLGRHPETGALMAPQGLEDEFETCERQNLSRTEIEVPETPSGGRAITKDEVN